MRGKVIIVIGMRRFFGLESKLANENSIVILVEFNENEVVALVVDDISEIMDVEVKSIADSPNVSRSDAKSEFLKGITYFKKDDYYIRYKKIIFHLTPILST